MNMNISGLKTLICCVGICAAMIRPAQAGIAFASTISLTLPDVTTAAFGTARDNLMTRLTMGLPPETESRTVKPTSLEVRDVFDAADIAVSTNLLWRGDFNPAAPFDAMHGMRIYVPVVLIGDASQLSLSKVSYRVVCGIALLGNESSLASLDYSVSRRGVLKGPDGRLFTPDDVMVTSGPGSQLVDAIVFIGARVGATVNTPEALSDLDAEIGNGMYANFQYFYDGSLAIQRTVAVFRKDMIPDSAYGFKPFILPTGVLYSIVGPANSPASTMEMTRDITGPWTVVSSTAREGSSGFAQFTGTATNDMAFFRLTPVSSGE